LWLGKALLKEFEHESWTQNIILDAFQQQRWRARIENPFGSQADQRKKQRLRKTVENLTHDLKLIRFYCDYQRRLLGISEIVPIILIMQGNCKGTLGLDFWKSEG
jgi:hypothetical protein